MPSALAVFGLMAGPMRPGLMSQLGQKPRLRKGRFWRKADIHENGEVSEVPLTHVGHPHE
jgi:hypothetical protein